MDPASFVDPRTGALVPMLDGHAFVPAPLPRELELAPATLKLIAQANRKLGELNGISSMLGQIADASVLISPLLYREAASSSRIEGTRATVRDLYLFEPEPTPEPERRERKEVLNYVAALRAGVERLRSGASPHSLWSIRRLHQDLFHGIDDGSKYSGEWRQRQCVIGSEIDTVATARYVPPPIDFLQDCLLDYEARLNSPSELLEVVELALLHYQFEAIHPFADGNGRIGRMLITLNLCAAGVLQEPLLILSPFFETRRQEYVDGLLAVSQRGAWEPWVEFFTRGVIEQAHDAATRAHHLLALRNHWLSVLREARKPALLGALVDSLFKSAATNATYVAKFLNVTRPTAMGYLKTLAQHGIVREIRFDRRQKWFFADAVHLAAVRPLDQLTITD